MRRPKPLSPLSTHAAVVEAFPSYRQSLLGKLDQCPLSTRFELEGADYCTKAQSRGILFHRFAAEVLRTLWRTGESTIPSEEAMVILREVERQEHVAPSEVVPPPGAHERRMLRILALKIANTPMNAKRIMTVEEQLETSLRYEAPEFEADGKWLRSGMIVERQITGRPDAIIADPPDGAIVLDWKSERTAPAEGYPLPEGQTVDDRVSVEGYWQQRFYALLVMRNYPAVDRVTLREYYPLPDEVREATVLRENLEHVEAEVGMLCCYLDRALQGGSDSPLWSPSPGRWCTYCRRPASCPIEADARAVEGGVTSQVQAEKIAAEVAVAEAVRKAGLDALKSWHERTGQPVPLRDGKARYEWRWSKDSSGRRRFKLVTPEKNTDREAAQ